jgi:hypothetical protein
MVGVTLSLSGYTLYHSLSFSLPYRPEVEISVQKKIAKLPDSLKFANETVHFKTVDSYRQFYKEYKYRTARNASTISTLRKAAVWLPFFSKLLKQYKLPDDLKYVALAESNLSNAYSPRGAVGFWQFTDVTARQFGLVINEEIDERLDPVKSTYAACKYFSKLYGYFGSWSSSAAAYNCGEAYLFYMFNKHQVNSYYDLNFKIETAGYMYRLLIIKDLHENPKKYGFKKYTAAMPVYKQYKVTQSIPNLATWCTARKIVYTEFLKVNPWILKHRLTISEEKPFYIVNLPN